VQLAGCDEQLVVVPQPIGQLRLPQLEAPVQVTSHAHASLQSTAAQELVPLHMIVQSPLHFTEAHDLRPSHATVHDDVSEHSMLRQPLLPHVIVQW
jgi:hypothetical protein